MDVHRWCSSYLRTAFTQFGLRRITLPAVLLVTLGASVAVDTYPRQWGIDALNYTFKVTFRDDADRIDAEATVESDDRGGDQGNWG